MKIYFASPQENFHPETIEFYESFATIVDTEEEADYVIINDFEPIETDKTVVANMTGTSHIKSPEIISLRGEDLYSFTAVPELSLGYAIVLMRQFRGEEVRGKKVAIIGAGRIGNLFAVYLSVLGAECTPYDNDPEVVKDTSEENLREILNTSDIVSLHITASEENRNFFDREKFEQMKEGAIFLNSARPWLVDEDALKWALDSKLSACWFDFDMPFEHPKLVTTPHLGGTTKESTKKSELLVAKKLEKLCG